MIRKIKWLPSIIRHLGWRWVLFRVFYSLQLKIGILQLKTPLVEWKEVPSVELNLQEWPEVKSSDQSLTGAAEAISRGEFTLFFWRKTEKCFPPNWHKNQFSGETAPEEIHWSKLGDFNFGDIKCIWDLNRFSWAFTLGRAYALTRDEKWAGTWWVLFEDWMEKNPPNAGVNWKCGQEVTFRLIASTFALEVMQHSRESTPERLSLFSQFVIQSGRRIAANIEYALSQKNNHGISECVGLITAALLVPGYKSSGKWRRRAERDLIRQLDELIYEDGSFSQHSLIYHRLMLHALIWCAIRINRAGEKSPDWLLSALEGATTFLMGLVDPKTGYSPLSGYNDGSDILPLSGCGYLDMRPVIQASAAVLGRQWPLEEGPWDEAAKWFSTQNQESRGIRLVRDGSTLNRDGGYFTWVAGSDRLYIRCPEGYRHKPSHSDLLHTDIVLSHVFVASDGGTYSYNEPTGKGAWLKKAAAHNVLVVEGHELMTPITRFLSLPWPRCRIIEYTPERMVVRNLGYEHLGVSWSRTTTRIDRGWRVDDVVYNPNGESLSLHWRLCDAQWTFDKGSCTCSLEESGKISVRWEANCQLVAHLVRGNGTLGDGAWAPYYGKLDPASMLKLEIGRGRDIKVSTLFLNVNS